MPERTFAFVDLAGFTALTEAHGDEEAVVLVERFEELTRAALVGGTFVKAIGDAALLAFVTPEAAVQSVGSVFDRILDMSSFPLPRAGMHHGPAIEREGDYLGASVNLAARVAAHARAGQLLATEPVAAVAAGIGVRVVHLGEFRLRNIAEPVDLYDVHVIPNAVHVVDPVCRMRIEEDAAVARIRYGDIDHWFCSLECVGRFAAAPETFTDALGRGSR